MPGHPDGQNYAIWRGPNFAANPTFPLSQGNPFSANGQVTNYASLILNMACNNPGGMSVVVNWFTDSTLTVPLSSDGWIVPAGFQLRVILPALGNFVRVDVTTPDVAASDSAIAVYPSNSQCSKPDYQGTRNVVESPSVSVAANTTVHVPLPHVMAGPGQLYVQDLTASAKLFFSVHLLKEDGTDDAVLINEPAPVTFDHKTFEAPAVPLSLKIQNTDGAASHTASYVLCVNSR